MTPWTVARQTCLSTGFSRPEYWSGLPFPSPGDLPDPGIKPGSPALQADSLLSESPGKPIAPVIRRLIKSSNRRECFSICGILVQRKPSGEVVIYAVEESSPAAVCGLQAILQGRGWNPGTLAALPPNHASSKWRRQDLNRDLHGPKPRIAMLTLVPATAWRPSAERPSHQASVPCPGTSQWRICHRAQGR